MSDLNDANAQAEAISQFVKKKGYLMVEGKKDHFTIPDQSVRKILDMIEEDFLVNWINCVIVKNVTHYENTKKETITQKRFQVQPCYLKLLSKIKEYLVIDPSYVHCSDNEKVYGTTKIMSNSFQRIMKMASFEWVEFLNFLKIIITQITYSTIERVMKKNSQVNIKYRKLYDFLLLYCMKMKKGKDVEISAYSLQKILNMIGLNLYDITEMLTINVLVLRIEEIKTWRDKNKRLRRLGSLLSLKKDIEINEVSLIMTVKPKYDHTPKMRQQMLSNFEKDSLKGADILQRKRERIALQKKYFKTQFDQDDTFVEVYDINENKAYIRKKIIYEIINSTDTTIDEFDVNDYHGKKVTLTRRRLISEKNDDKDEYYPMNYSIHEGTGDKMKIICKPLLVKKKYITLLYEQWKSDKAVEIFENKADNTIIKCSLAQLTFAHLDKAELPMQPKEVEMMSSKKIQFEKYLNNPYKIFIEYHNKKLIKSHLYDKIIEHPGNFDEFSVINHVDGKPFVVSKKQLRAKPKSAYPEYVEVTYKNKSTIIKKIELEGALLGWNHMSNRTKLNTYPNDNEEEFDLSNVQLMSDREELKGQESVNELPYQIGEAKEAQVTIEKDLIDDDVFYKVPDLNILVRGKIIKEAKDMDKGQENNVSCDDSLITVSDNDNKKLKVSKRLLFKNDLEPYYEIEDKANNKKAYIKKADLTNGLSDFANDEIPLEDHMGNKLRIKKSNIRIMKQPYVRMPVQMEPIKATIRKAIKHDFIVIPDENGKQTLIRSEYIPLITNHQSSVKFDRYEIPNYRELNCYVSKKALNEIKPNDLEKFVFVKNKKQGSNHYFTRKCLLKYTNENHDTKEKELLEFDEYDLTMNQPEQKNILLTKKKMPLEDIDIGNTKNITSLPPQDEENKMKELIERRQKVSQFNDEIDYVQIPNEKGQSILIRKKIANEILKDNKGLSQTKTTYKIINCIKNEEDIINPAKINTDPKKTDDVYSLITIPSIRKGEYFVNKNKLSACLNKADNSNSKLDVTAYPNNEILNSATVMQFEFAKAPNVSLPKQDELKSTIKAIDPKDLNKMTKKKEELKKDLDDLSKILIEPADNKLIKSNLYPKIVDHTGNYDEFTVNNHIDNKPIIISKTKLKAKPRTSYPEYVAILDNTKPKANIVKKNDLDKAIAHWNGLLSKASIKNYDGREDEYDLIDTKIVTDSDDTLVFQAGDGKQIKDALDKDLNEDNEFNLLSEPKIIVRSKIVKGIKDQGKLSNNDEEKYITLPDHDNKNFKVNKRVLFKNDLVSLVEIEDTDSKKNAFVKTKQLEKGLADLHSEEILLEDDQGNKIKVRKINIRIVKQLPVTLPTQMEPIKINIRQGIKNDYVVIPDENNKPLLIRSEYIPLVKSHKSSLNIDRYTIPDYKDINGYISKKALNDIKPNDIEELVKVKNKKNGGDLYFTRKDLMKYTDKDYKVKPNEMLEFDEYDPVNHQRYNAKLHFSKKNMPLEDIEIFEVKSISSLPIQDEENKIKELIEKKDKANQMNAETDFVLVPNEKKKPILIRKTITNEILKDIKGSKQPRTSYKVINCIKNSEDTINPININTDANTTDDVYTMIDIPLLNNTTFYVNKNKLKDCLNKADSSVCKLDLTSYPDNAILASASVIDFNYTKLPDVSLPKQDELKPIIRREDLDLINKKKDELKKDLENSSKLLIEPCDKKLIKSNQYDKIANHPGNFDDFIVKNHYDGFPTNISKKALKSQPKSLYPEYVEITHISKPAIIKKNDLEGAINGWIELSDRPKIKLYSSGKDKEFNLLYTNVSGDIDDDLPAQLGEAKDIKNDLENDMTDNNQFNMFPQPKFLIRATIIKQAKDLAKLSDIDDENIITVPDNDNINKNINSKTILNTHMDPFFEIEEKDTKKTTYVNKTHLEKGLEDLSSNEMMLEDEKGNKFKVRKSNIRIVKQPPVSLPPQMEQIKLKIRRAMVNDFTVIPDENNKPTLIRNDYLSLIINHQSSVKFDSYEIPNYKETNFYVSKKALKEIKPEEIEELILVKSIKTKSNHYLTRNSLLKYVNKDYLAKEKEELEFDEYDLSSLNLNQPQTKGKINFSKRKMTLEEIEVVKVKSNLILPPQEEEKRMKILIDRRDKANLLNPQTDFIQISNQRSQPILIRKKIENDILAANKEAIQPRMVFKVINCIKDEEDRINVLKINLDSTKTDDVYTMIDINTMRNKTYYVNKNKLRDCLNKAHNSRCKLEVIAYPGHEILAAANVIDFDYTILPDVSLLPQDELKPQSTMYIEEANLESLPPTYFLRPESGNMPEGGIENDVLEDMDESNKVYSKPKPSRAAKPPTKSKIPLEEAKSVNQSQKPILGKPGIDSKPEKEKKNTKEVINESLMKPIKIGQKKTTFAIRRAVVKKPLEENKDNI